MRKKKNPRRIIDLREHRTNRNDRTARQVGLCEDLRTVNSGENNPHDG